MMIFYFIFIYIFLMIRIMHVLCTGNNCVAKDNSPLKLEVENKGILFILSTHLLVKLSPPILAIAARRSLLPAVVDWLAFVVSVVALCNVKYYTTKQRKHGHVKSDGKSILHHKQGNQMTDPRSL